MKISHTNIVKLAAVVLAMGLFTGCATTAQVEQAQRDATAAMRVANEASQKADQALQEAAAAKRAASECTAKCDRMFQQSMSK